MALINAGSLTDGLNTAKNALPIITDIVRLLATGKIGKEEARRLVADRDERAKLFDVDATVDGLALRKAPRRTAKMNVLAKVD